MRNEFPEWNAMLQRVEIRRAHGYPTQSAEQCKSGPNKGHSDNDNGGGRCQFDLENCFSWKSESDSVLCVAFGSASHSLTSIDESSHKINEVFRLLRMHPMTSAFDPMQFKVRKILPRTLEIGFCQVARLAPAQKLRRHRRQVVLRRRICGAMNNTLHERFEQTAAFQMILRPDRAEFTHLETQPLPSSSPE